jgi:HSP20 family protein
MANLMRNENLFEHLFDFRRDFDEKFNRLLNGSGLAVQRPARLVVAVPPIEAWVDKENKKYHLSIAVPGIDPKEVEVNLQGNNLTVSGEHKSKEEKKGTDFLQEEFSYGRFERSVVLPEGIDMDKIHAEYKNGVLEIEAPLTAAALPKRIEVKSTPAAKTASA